MATSCNLSIKDFNDVSLKCRSVSPQWNTLAKHLNVGVTIVEGIEAGGRDTVWCLDGLLKAWLRQTSSTQPSPTWRILCNAIANIDRPLSEKIWSDHTEGCDLCRGRDELKRTKRSREEELQVSIEKRKEDQRKESVVMKMRKDFPIDRLNKELCDAAESGDTDYIEILIESGAHVNTKSTKEYSEGQTPLHLASSKGHSEAVILLISRGAIVNIKNDQDETPLYEASSSDVVNILISHGATVNENINGDHTPLHRASFNGHSDVVDTLLSHGATVNEKDHWGHTPLHVASSGGHSDIVNKLLSHGATVNVKSVKGNTPLHFASHSDNSDTVNVLLSHGAIVNSVNEIHQTPLHYFFAYKNEEIRANAELLISHGADLYHEDKYGNSPVLMATVFGCEDLMLSHGVSEDIVSKYHLPSGWEATWSNDDMCIQYTNTVTGVKQKTHPSLSDSTTNL